MACGIGCEFNNIGLTEAVHAYVTNPSEAVATHGPIATWNVSGVDSMAQLFCILPCGSNTAQETFNADLSSWDVR